MTVIVPPRHTPYGDCAICTHCRAPWHCGHPAAYPVPVPVDMARAPAGWPEIATEIEPGVWHRRIDSGKPYSEGGRCGASRKLFMWVESNEAQ